MRDGEDISTWPDALGHVISHIHGELFETYSKYDTISLQKQRYHKIFAYFAVLFGTTAILLAIFQVTLRLSLLENERVLENVDIVKYFELFSLSIAVLAVSIAVGSHQHKGWLKKRFLAEQCRSLKFRALIHPFLWCSSKRSWEDRYTQWKERFNEKAALLKEAREPSIEECIKSDEINAPPPDITKCSFEAVYIRSLVDYYQKKRLLAQIAYFKERAFYFESINKSTGWIPNFCFIASVECAAGHFGIELLNSPNPSLTFISSILLLLTLLFPIFAIGARTLRSSIEVSRSDALYQSKSRALEHFNMRLDEELLKEFIQWGEILKILWQCENFFENENREWLRMMNEAEWFI
jgi:hypothetical protein